MELKSVDSCEGWRGYGLWGTMIVLWGWMRGLVYISDVGMLCSGQQDGDGLRRLDVLLLCFSETAGIAWPSHLVFGGQRKNDAEMFTRKTNYRDWNCSLPIDSLKLARRTGSQGLRDTDTSRRERGGCGSRNPKSIHKSPM